MVKRGACKTEVGRVRPEEHGKGKRGKHDGSDNEHTYHVPMQTTRYKLILVKIRQQNKRVEAKNNHIAIKKQREAGIVAQFWRPSTRYSIFLQHEKNYVANLALVRSLPPRKLPPLPLPWLLLPPPCPRGVCADFLLADPAFPVTTPASASMASRRSSRRLAFFRRPWSMTYGIFASFGACQKTREREK